MSLELPKKPIEGEVTPEMSAEDFEEMIAQVPVLREMLAERRAELAALERAGGTSTERAETLRHEVAELESEIEGRELAL